MLVLQEGNYLLIKRGNEPGLGTWCPPSGFMEAGESMEETAERELFEETGLEGKAKELIGVYFESPHIYGHVIAIVYLMEITGGELRAGDDALDARFFPRESLPDIPFRCFREAIARVNSLYPG
jgi:8-oxo-dGTP diphosphatase